MPHYYHNARRVVLPRLLSESPSCDAASIRNLYLAPFIITTDCTLLVEHSTNL